MECTFLQTASQLWSDVYLYYSNVIERQGGYRNCFTYTSLKSAEYHHQGRHMSLLFACAADVAIAFADVDGLFERSSTTTAK